MKSDWIKIALENGGELSCWMNHGKFIARIFWIKNGQQLQTEESDTINDCLNKLNNDLWDDAANQCEC
jgi:hypothetical protein